MKTGIILCGIFSLVLAGLGFSPIGTDHAPALFGGLALVGLATIVAAFLPGKRPGVAIPGVPAMPPPPAAEMPSEPEPPPPPPALKLVAESGVVLFLGAMQEKGRLLDFLMDDITPYSDAQVGAAARVVHQGCKTALREHVSLSPIAIGTEGAAFTIPAETPKEAFRLLGNPTGEPPFSGTLVHKGWKADAVKLPRLITSSDALPILAPAQVEVKS